MERLTVFLLILGVTLGFDVTDIFHEDTELPKKAQIAQEKGWENVETDTKLNIMWYNKGGSPVQMAFDKKDILAGVRLAIPKDSNDVFYKNSKLFLEKSIKIDNKDKTVYVATVILTDSDILKGGGRRVNADDEIIDTIYLLDKTGKETRIQREACAQLKFDDNIFAEKRCEDTHGLVLAPFKDPSSTCDNPFFLVYDEIQKGNLLGFGWLVPASDVEGSKALENKDRYGKSDLEKLFPSSPTCLAGKTAVNIWLAKEESKKMNCEVKNKPFKEERCGVYRGPGGDEDF
ncbi:uncharacterized protein LOC128996931 isoform X1 [Macrosteles quadrilineatus]|uniref:uncharacterized protein LOC128996931 isoform X1 n=1 Tax=Macrosteles quadrilineatus TaxID=74068 RepID=UPI0023E0BD43|nr:uncharacterized protein LOC128996931 isoform X1 [Macrosteles quadrilineatus]